MVHVIAIITAKAGERAAILEAFHANVPAVLAEDGCIEYSAVIDTVDGPAFQTPAGPDTFMVIEKWSSVEALQAHAAAPHMATYAAKARPHIANRVVHVLSSAF